MSDETPEIMWAGKYITAKRQGKWEYVSRSRGIRAAVILAVDESESVPHVILVEQYRMALGKACLELPAGLVGDDDSGEDEDLAQTAIRELEEETGYLATTMHDLGEFYSSPGMVSESFTLFRAEGLTRVHDGGGLEDENIIVHRVPVQGVSDYVAQCRAQGIAIDVKLLLLLGGGMLSA